MAQKRVYPHWKDLVVFSARGPQPQTLLETENCRAMISGLQAGQTVPPHPEGPALFYFLEGAGWMTVGEERFAVQTGATVVVPEDALRGFEAETQLVFLAVRMA
jgi:quercetin dioxygenase-like cupin family protein